MGWTGTYKPTGMSIDDFFEKEFGNFKFVGKGALINLREYYRAFEYEVDKDNNLVFDKNKTNDPKMKRYGVVVCLISMTRDKQFNFSYKEMTSDMGPFYYNCPERILKIAEQTPPLNDWDNDWRLKCRNVIAKKKQINNLEEGDLIKFPNPLRFTNGYECDTFYCHRMNKKPNTKGKLRLQMFLDGYSIGCPVKISSWKSKEFQIIKAKDVVRKSKDEIVKNILGGVA